VDFGFFLVDLAWISLLFYWMALIAVTGLWIPHELLCYCCRSGMDFFVVSRMALISVFFFFLWIRLGFLSFFIDFGVDFFAFCCVAWISVFFGFVGLALISLVFAGWF